MDHERKGIEKDGFELRKVMFKCLAPCNEWRMLRLLIMILCVCAAVGDKQGVILFQAECQKSMLCEYDRV